MKLNLAAMGRCDQQTVVYALGCVFGYLIQSRAQLQSRAEVSCRAEQNRALMQSRQSRAAICDVVEQTE